jgi:pyruvate,orthophosphate dikinase
MKDLLGGKGSGLAEMTNAGLPVPPGFTISTQACNIYYERGGVLPAEVGEQIPEEFFAAVAEILAYVYSLKGRTAA